QVVRIENHLGHTSRREYTNGRLTKSIGPRWDTTTFAYDSDGNLVSRTDPLGAVTSWAYDSEGNLTSLTDALGQKRTYEYNGAGQLAALTMPGRGRTAMGYNALGQMIGIATPMGDITWMEYDTFGNLAATVDPHGRRIAMAYDPQGFRCTSITDRRGNTTEFIHDANGRLTKLTHPDASYLSHTYLPCTRIATRDENDGLTTATRNMLMSIVLHRNPEGQEYLFDYDEDNNLVSRTDPLGHVTTFEYDETDRPVGVVDRNGKTVAREFDQSWNLKSFTDERGNKTKYGYDLNNRLTVVQDALVRRVEVTRDLLGRVASYLNARGQTVAFEYDEDGNLIRKSHDGTTVAEFARDLAGRIEYAYSPGHSVQFTHDSCQWVTAIRYSDSTAMAFAHDADGNLTRADYPQGLLTVHYAYDSRNRLTAIGIDGTTSTLTLDPVGNVVAVARPNSVSSASTFDAANRATHCQVRKGAASPFIQIDTTRNDLGAIAQETATFPVAPLLAPQSATATYNKLNQIVQRDGETYTYDLDGNLVSISGSRAWTGEYDAENRLVQTVRNGVATAYSYDSFGNRVRTISDGATRDCHYDQEGRLLYETDDDAEIAVMYIYAGSRPFAMRTRGGATYYYHHSPKGDTLALTGASGNVAAAYAYSPTGLVCNQTGSLYNPFTFCGSLGVQDEGDGLFLMRHRHYDARTGRFVQRDPIGISGGSNVYAYARGNFANWTDPLGLDTIMGGTFDIDTCTMPTNFDDMTISDAEIDFFKRAIDDYAEIPGAPGGGIYKGGKALGKGNVGEAFYEFGKEITGKIGIIADILEKVLPKPPIDPNTGRVIFPENNMPEYNNTGW
ncbi:RHS repeat protein, partial [Candidatus Sumerlaeota bacterium]|nr:RHS repeat protein [Candidatus Sumerlaeota bacterium]